MMTFMYIMIALFVWIWLLGFRLSFYLALQWGNVPFEHTKVVRVMFFLTWPIIYTWAIFAVGRTKQ